MKKAAKTKTVVPAAPNLNDLAGRLESLESSLGSATTPSDLRERGQRDNFDRRTRILDTVTKIVAYGLPMIAVAFAALALSVVVIAAETGDFAFLKAVVAKGLEYGLVWLGFYAIHIGFRDK